MISNRFRLAATLLTAGAFFALPTPAYAGGEGESPQEVDSRVVELKLMARRLMSRVDEHRERLNRLDTLIRFHRVRGQAEEVRKLEVLRLREIESFEQTLAEIHRLLGSQDFERVSAAVRYLSNHPVTYPEGSAATAELARATPMEGSAAAVQAPQTRAQASIERSVDRQIMLERARASQKLQLAQRLQAARDQQLRLIAQQQRRFQPTTSAASGRERGANASATTPPSGGRRQAPPSRRP